MQKLLVKNNFKSKAKFIELLNSLFNKKVYRFTYLGKCRLNKMPEYDFSLYEFNVMLEDFTNYTVFIKKISRANIEETLFCYWQFCEENYNIHGNFYMHKARLKNEVFKESQDFVQKYILQLLSKNNKIWKASNINIVDLNKMEAQKSFKSYEGNRKMHKESYDDTKEYLFIGII